MTPRQQLLLTTIAIVILFMLLPNVFGLRDRPIGFLNMKPRYYFMVGALAYLMIEREMA